MLASLATIVGSGTAMSIGSAYGTAEQAWTVFLCLCALLVPAGITALAKDKKLSEASRNQLKAQKDSLNSITDRYNNTIKRLENQYNREKSHYGLFSSSGKEQLRRQYEQQYKNLARLYKQERESVKATFAKDSPETQRMKRFWTNVFTLGFIAQLTACGFSMGALTEPEPESIGRSMTSQTETEERYWNADNIPMPHLEDASRYVSNPDHVVSDNTEYMLNARLKQLDDSLQIESVMILVNHIENDDPFRMAQDVGNKFGVGKSDRGLVIVVGYEDHSIQIAPGRSLEADLTDVECHRLQEQYVFPFMRNEQPDSAMLYLTEAVYNLLQKKELPVIQDYSAQEDEDFVIIFLYWLLMGGWAIFAGVIASRYGAISSHNLSANPFARDAVVVGVGGGHGGGSGFGGGGFGGGGSFGGGSFGGGGATGRW